MLRVQAQQESQLTGMAVARAELRSILATSIRIQVYWSARERELNCMIAVHSAPYVHGLYDKSAQWHYLNESVSEIPLEELVEQTRSDKALFKNRDTWLTWLAARIDEYYESAVAGIQGETDLNGDHHEHH